MIDAGQVHRQYIFALAGPVIGWIVLCAVLGKPALLIIGTLVGWPFIYLFGLPLGVLVYCIDRELIDRSMPLWLRSLGCLLSGGILSFVLIEFVPLPLSLDHPGALLASLPGAIAGVVCAAWGDN
ncbi:hypothetical protein [Bradyrhizobium sp. HKCCYLR20261]|uniref:hypothetical protein n=1 Tax=unclassified Bradyrhizobium TaxID=2631580 RepID=UPI003EB699F7